MFSPFDLASVHAQSTSRSEKSASSIGYPSNNISVQAPSLRGRLECIPIDMSNTSAWLTTLNLTDLAAWSIDGRTSNLTVAYEINLGFSTNSSVADTGTLFNISAAGYQMPSSESGVNSSEETAIGYWTHAADDPHESIIVQWITGYPIPYQLRNSLPQDTQTHWAWKNIPKITALKCVPVFEFADATVNVDLATGAVQNYTITNAPSPDLHAWSSRYQVLNVSTGVPYSSNPGIGAGFQTKPGIFLQNVSVRYVVYILLPQIGESNIN